ncbi:hypothetical protein QVD17_00575 [Tagetes erecta]|uniref:SBP-type domain-containing protein n=1 Tax=Tagetes erecta TaxID=13708 RepID=A0AAD8P7I4_TARER|nr:hypothetical protein QVD17_00575 [Tagetes erecta]
MDWNLNTPTESSSPSEWDWENLPMYAGTNQHDICFYGSVDSSSKEKNNTFGTFDDLPKDLLEKDECSWLVENVSFCNTVDEGFVLSGDAMIGLKLGKHAYNTSSSNDKMDTVIKRSRASYVSSLSTHCQVEGCNLDLSSAKDYHRRHRICANHSKSPKVVVDGMERRFHDLSEFDDRKRSCRRRLSAHNARRRRPQSEEIDFSSTRIPSIIICDPRPQMKFHPNRSSIRILNSTQPEHSPTNGTLNFSSARFMPRNTNLNGVEPTSNSILRANVNNAFSRLSTSSWSSNVAEDSLSFNQFADGNSISMAQKVKPLEPQNATNTTQLHEFECFYAN